MRTPRALIALALFLAAPLTITATAAGATPVNDNYLSSLPLNNPGEQLNRTETLTDTRDTSQATTQGDVFTPNRDGAPGSGGGPAEVTACGGSLMGKTVWYDFYPDLNGVVRLRANGFNAAIAVLQFDPKTSRPVPGGRICSNASASGAEEFLANVRGNRAYSVQIGGVGGVGGPLEFLFDFIPSFPHLKADPTLLVRPNATGVELVSLRVAASRGARVTVSCTRHACRKESKKAKRRAVSFKRLAGRKLKAGSTLAIRVTRKDSVGRYIAFKIKRGRFTKVERCLKPGSRKPSLCG